MSNLMIWWRWDAETSENGKHGMRIRQQELLPPLGFAREFVAPDSAVGDHGWFAGMLLDFVTDNESNSYVLNKGRSRDPATNQMVREFHEYLRAGSAQCISS